MDRRRWQRLEQLLQDALDRAPASRDAFLDEACAGDATLRADVVALIRQHEGAGSFLEQPLVQVAEPAADGTDATNQPTQIGPYRMIRPIGEGGMGVVWLAMQQGDGFERPVAVKLMRRGLDTDELLRRFHLERRILATLRHPNIAHLIDAGATDDGRPYFVMQFVDGLPIDRWCERQQLPLSDRLRLFQSVCAAVAHAHANLVVHRDIKPGNILVADDGTPVLLDFGIGKLLDTGDGIDATLTGMGARAFTPQYASPEQVRGEPVSTATDVHGLGALLYHLLTGRGPFADRPTPAESEQAVLRDEPTRPSSVGGRALAGDLDNIVLKALRKEPERRYQSVVALSDDIQRHLDGLPVRARPDTFSYRTAKFIRRQRLPLAAATVVFASLVAAAVYSNRQARAVASERDRALEVRGFLLETFGAGGSSGADAISVRQLLERQAASLDAYVPTPQLHAEMLTVVAEGYERLGLFRDAEPLARQALEVRRATLDERHPDIPAAIGLLGWILHQQGKSAEGEALLREAVALWSDARPANPGGHSRALNDLGAILEVRGNYGEATTLYRDALAMRRARFGDAHRAVAVTANNLSTVLAKQGDYQGAIPVAQEALRVMRNSAGPDHQRSMLIQGNLAALRSATGDLDGSIAEYRDVLARQLRVQGRMHPITGGTLYALGAVLRARGQFEESERFLREALEVYESVLGREHPRVGTTLMQLGRVATATGRYEEARALLDRSIAIARTSQGATHRDVGTAMVALADLHARAGRSAEAVRAQRSALEILERALGGEHRDVIAARAKLAALDSAVSSR